MKQIATITLHWSENYLLCTSTYAAALRDGTIYYVHMPVILILADNDNTEIIGNERQIFAA